MSRLALACLLALMLGACAGTAEKPAFRLALDPAPETKKLMWPSAEAGEVPRYLYLGELTGENNFVQPESRRAATRNVIARFFDIIIGEEPPLVMDRPQSGAVDEQGRILVTDMGRAAVFVFDETAGKLAVWGKAMGVTDFIAPVGIAVGPSGQTFVADPELAIVARLDHDGNPLEPIGQGMLQRPTGVAYDPKTRRLFVADTPAHQIKVFDLEGNLLNSIGEHGEGPGQFNHPTHLALRHEKLYVSDSLNARIHVISAPTGRYLGTVGKRGLFVGNLVRPKGVAADSEQNVYAVESYHDYLLIYNRRGEFLLPIGGVGTGPGNFHLPAGVWVDARDRVFVADMLNGRVAVFQFLGGEGGNDDR